MLRQISVVTPTFRVSDFHIAKNGVAAKTHLRAGLPCAHLVSQSPSHVIREIARQQRRGGWRDFLLPGTAYAGDADEKGVLFSS